MNALTEYSHSGRVWGYHMNRIILGQILLILCCIVYLVWWYRGFRPGITVNRIGGMNGALLAITAILGISGVVFSLLPSDKDVLWKTNPLFIIAGGIIGYIVLLFVTRYMFDRVVTSELFLIIGWTMLETAVINRLNAEGMLGEIEFTVMCVIIAAAFIISMILYVAYYKMEEMKAFYAAMIPLITEGAAMAVLVCMMI